jgi:hypothetical protein
MRRFDSYVVAEGGYLGVCRTEIVNESGSR